MDCRQKKAKRELETGRRVNELKTDKMQKGIRDGQTEQWIEDGQRRKGTGGGEHGARNRRSTKWRNGEG